MDKAGLRLFLQQMIATNTNKGVGRIFSLAERATPPRNGGGTAGPADFIKRRVPGGTFDAAKGIEFVA